MVFVIKLLVMEAYHRRAVANLNIKCSFFLQWVIMCCDLMRTEECQCNESVEMEQTSEGNGENASVPITSDFRLLSLGCPL
jgi:hypothetical protein